VQGRELGGGIFRAEVEVFVERAVDLVPDLTTVVEESLDG
jgi:hypothetical protein